MFGCLCKLEGTSLLYKGVSDVPILYLAPVTKRIELCVSWYADYSGAMVLQIPLDAACHVALQMQPVSQHRLWRHMQAALRLSSPVIRVVSMTADKNNRCAEHTGAS